MWQKRRVDSLDLILSGLLCFSLSQHDKMSLSQDKVPLLVKTEEELTHLVSLEA